jgi:hypothetical protein
MKSINHVRVFFTFLIGRRVLLSLLMFFTTVWSVQAQVTTRSAGQESKPQIATAKSGDAKAAIKPPFTLSIKSQPILNISLKADKARLSEIADAISKRLKVPVFLGTAMEKEVISTEFSELTLEPAMQLLAPSVYIDYEVRTGAGAAPHPLGIFFYAADQGEPPVTAVVTGSSQSLLVEGDTEEGTEAKTDEQRKKEEEQPLKVSYAKNLLSVKAKKQSLVLVLLKIGEQLGIPVDIENQTQEMVDVEVSNMPVEDVVRRLSPNIQLFLRADLTHAERRALRLVLSEPLKSAQ